MRTGSVNQVLPKKRRISFVEFISNSSTRNIALLGMLLYILPVLLFTIIETIFLYAGHPLIYDNSVKENAANLFELLYFNFITIITIGYGDLHPVSLGCFFSVLEGVIGVGIFGLLVAAITTKLLSPQYDSIVFSRYGYYCTEEQRFLLIFVNTTKTNMINVDLTSYFKLGGHWGVSSAVRTPFITTSVQTFFLDKERLDDIIKLLQKYDVFRFGISGTIGVSTYSTAIQYSVDEIIMIPNREELTRYKDFHSPDFQSVDISEMFHYRPEGSLTLNEYVKLKRKNIQQSHS